MLKSRSQENRGFTWSINSRMVAVNVLVLVVATLLLFLSLSAATVKPPQQVVNITPITDTAAAVPVAQDVMSEQPNGKATATAVVDKPAREEAPQWPLPGKVVLAYGWQLHPVFKDWRYHRGMDIAAEQGQPVTAVLSGTVVTSGEAKQTGLTVVIVSGGRQISYGCLSHTGLSTGQKISQGEVVGFTGQSITEPYPHLHLGLQMNEEYQDPQKIFE